MRLEVLGGYNMREWTKEEKYRVLKTKEEIAGLRERIVESDYRQTFHIQPTTGLLNDPNGFVWHDGLWHLFYQWCPWGAVHGLKYWYHTTSKNLVTWENKGVCIRPDTEYDNKGAYSGSAFIVPNKNGDIALFYTGNHREEDWTRISYTCTVILDKDGKTNKAEKPLFGPSPEFTEHQRDPKILYIKERNKYYIVIGAQTKNKKGTVIVYESDKLFEEWKFAGELKVPGFEDFGDMWECPSIENIGGKDVLIFCPQHLNLPRRGNAIHHNGYILGTMDWDNLVFIPDGSFHVLDFGYDSYAAECAANIQDSDKAVLVAWMGLPDSAYPTDEEDWSGCLTLPRELKIRNRRLIQKPLDCLVELREQEIEPTGELPRVCEMEIENPGGDLELKLFTKADGSGGLTIKYTDSDKMISVNRGGLDNQFNEEQGQIREHLIDFSLSHLRIYIDRSSVEIFVNNGDAVFTSRVFPTKEEIGFVLSNNATVKIWKLKPAVKDDFVV